jgi:hypothetical protein
VTIQKGVASSVSIARAPTATGDHHQLPRGDLSFQAIPVDGAGLQEPCSLPLGAFYQRCQHTSGIVKTLPSIGQMGFQGLKDSPAVRRQAIRNLDILS